MELQVSVPDILMIIDGHARQVQAALANPKTLNTEGLKSHIARMFAYADKLHEVVSAQQQASNGEEAKAN